ncbi:crotonase/enoyl-CoA hydratase family protein, partial [Escherichia coli]|nr:crotonase/enoyl-CoA hydratase family protein [Escherichia coli]
NAVNGPTAAALCAAFEQFDRDDAASVAVLWGAGGTFCAGADLKAFGTPEANSVHRTGPGPMGPSRMMLSKPVIAAVSGYAVAGGLELALWCDLRVAEEDAVFGVFCRRWGVPLIDGGTVRLPRLIGHSRAMDMILTGRGVPADEALAM